MQTLRRLLAILALVMLVPTARASLIFDFSFDNVQGNTPGPITGEIHGLVNDMAGQKALKVVITRIGSHQVFGHGLPLDVVLDNWEVGLNSFSVFTGAIANWAFSAFHNHAADSIVFELLELGNPQVPPLFTVNAGDSLLTAASDPTRFVLRVSAVPAPSALLLVGIGLAGMCFARRGGRLVALSARSSERRADSAASRILQSCSGAPGSTGHAAAVSSA